MAVHREFNLWAEVPSSKRQATQDNSSAAGKAAGNAAGVCREIHSSSVELSLTGTDWLAPTGQSQLACILWAGLDAGPLMLMADHSSMPASSMVA